MKVILRLNYIFFPFLTILTMFFLFVECVTYAGFLSKYLILNAKSFMFLNVVSGMILVTTREAEFSGQYTSTGSLYKFLFQLSYLFTPVIFIFYYLMISAEASNYPNFVFSNFHIIPDNFIYLLFSSLFVLIVGLILEHRELAIVFSRFFYTSKNAKSKTSSVEKAAKQIVIILIAFFMIGNLMKTVREIAKSNVYIVQNINNTYDQKMTASWNDFYRYMIMIKKVTPEDAVIQIPPSVRPWLSEGNSVLVRYFLYPRKLISPDEPATQTLKPQYYFLAKGFWKADPSEYGWPKEKVYSRKIYYFDLQSGKIASEDKTYDPLDAKNKNSWGLIEVK